MQVRTWFNCTGGPTVPRLGARREMEATSLLTWLAGAPQQALLQNWQRQ